MWGWRTEQGLTTNSREWTSWGSENVLNMDCGDGCRTL